MVLAGGHTIQDEEPKYGLIVLGFVHPDKAITKTGARPGDRLFLTKPLGLGVTTSALKKQKAEPEDIEEAVGWMKQLNDKSAELAMRFEVARRNGYHRVQPAGSCRRDGGGFWGGTAI